VGLHVRSVVDTGAAYGTTPAAIQREWRSKGDWPQAPAWARARVRVRVRVRVRARVRVRVRIRVRVKLAAGTRGAHQHVEPTSTPALIPSLRPTPHPNPSA